MLLPILQVIGPFSSWFYFDVAVARSIASPAPGYHDIYIK